ncbi:MAG TPA: tetratricopeptide repeat protein [Candidatus Baltobacteraceae bacterium]|nr:tetratricopeptide repeat protein [Candidatus Baltobacteraceae bacterium]
MEINLDLPVSMFHPPDWDRTPVQSMIQRIFDERTETQAVMATYRDFRAIVDVRSKAASDAVDFVGYQCLKMGQIETALALLAENVSENPGSARAHFGFGRALAASGTTDEARAQYRAALSLDPNYHRAQAALDDLH